MSGFRKQKPFGIVFDPRSQPGFAGRYGVDASRLVAQNTITGGPSKDPQNEPYSATQVLRPQQNLREKFVTMQVPQLLPSNILRRKG